MIEYVAELGYLNEGDEPNNEVGFMVDLTNQFQLQNQYDADIEVQRIRHESAMARARMKRIAENVCIGINAVLSFVGATTIAFAISGLLGG